MSTPTPISIRIGALRNRGGHHGLTHSVNRLDNRWTARRERRRADHQTGAQGFWRLAKPLTRLVRLPIRILAFISALDFLFDLQLTNFV